MSGVTLPLVVSLATGHKFIVQHWRGQPTKQTFFLEVAMVRVLNFLALKLSSSVAKYLITRMRG